jgi:hypothetical protein
MPKTTTQLAEVEVIVEDVSDEDDDNEDDVVPAPASTTVIPGVVKMARAAPLSPSTLQPVGGLSPRPSSLSPHAAPFHPRGSSVGRSKARRWVDADLGAGSSDDEPTPAATRLSYLDAARKALRATSPPSARAMNATHRVVAVEGALQVPARGKRRQRRHRRRRPCAPAGRGAPPPLSKRVPAQRRLGQ